MSAPELSFEQLEPALLADDSRAVIDAFAGRTEAERRAVAPAVLGAVMPGSAGRRARDLAVLACASLSELRKRERIMFLQFGDEEYEVLADRRPSWLEKWITRQLERPLVSGGGWRSPWPLCRRLIRAGLCAKPDTEAYIVRMITGIGWHPELERSRRRTLRQILLDDPGLLEDEIWRLFEVEGERRGHNLTTYGRGWAMTLARLGDEGVIARERLLDSTLDALERDFSEYNTRWFQAFHARLAPSPEEFAARTHRYLRLLANRLFTTVALALEALAALEQNGALDAGELARHVAAPLGAAPKKTAIAALGLLGRAIERDAGARAAGLAAAAAALENRSVDVQKRALDLIGCHPDAMDDGVTRELLRFADAIAPSLRSPVDRLTGIDLAVIAEGHGEPRTRHGELERRAAALPAAVRSRAGIDAALDAVRVPELPRAITFSARELPIAGREPLAPLEDHEELLALLTRLIESVDSADDVERALDGVARLCGSQPPGFASAAKPLRKRALAIVNSRADDPPAPLAWGDPRADLCGVAAAWLARDAMTVRPRSRAGRLSSRLQHEVVAPGPGALLSDRALAVAESAFMGEPRPLLATPTHAGGWIDPSVLAGRLAAIGAAGGTRRSDAILAVLRLAAAAPDAPPAALDEFGGELGCAVRAALGESRLEPGPTAALWAAVAAVRQVGAIADGAVLEQPPANRSARSSLVFEDPMQVGSRLSRAHWTIFAKTVRWVATVWPAWREPFYAVGAAHHDRSAGMAPTLDEGAFIEPLLDPDEPLLADGTAALMSAIAARDTGRASVAVDAMIAAISDGRLDHDQLPRALSSSVSAGRSRARMAPRLEGVAGASELTEECVRLALERSLSAQADAPAHDAHAFLGLLYELAVDAGAGISDRATRTSLEGFGSRSKAGKLARDLLALEARPSRHTEAASTEALEGRLLRGERWAGALRAPRA